MTALPEIPLSEMSESELGALVCRVTDELSGRGTNEAFAEMLTVVAHTGRRVGDAARLLAATNSWSRVAEVSGTSKQAAWERWRT